MGIPGGHDPGDNTSVLTSVSVIEMLVAASSSDEGRLFGPIVWIVLQIPVILFSHRSRKALSEATS